MILACDNGQLDVLEASVRIFVGEKVKHELLARPICQSIGKVARIARDSMQCQKMIDTHLNIDKKEDEATNPLFGSNVSPRNPRKRKRTAPNDEDQASRPKRLQRNHASGKKIES